jgi:hypothetical protein
VADRRQTEPPHIEDFDLEERLIDSGSDRKIDTATRPAEPVAEIWTGR